MALALINIDIMQQLLLQGPNDYAFIYQPSTFCSELTLLMNNILMNQADIIYRFTNMSSLHLPQFHCGVFEWHNLWIMEYTKTTYVMASIRTCWQVKGIEWFHGKGKVIYLYQD